MNFWQYLDNNPVWFCVHVFFVGCAAFFSLVAVAIVVHEAKAGRISIKPETKTPQA